MKCSRGFLCIWRWACGAGTSAKGWHFAVDKMPTATATPNNFFKSKVKFYRGPNGQQKQWQPQWMDGFACSSGQASSIVYLVSYRAFD